MDSVKKDIPIKKQARELIYKVYLYFVNEGNAFKHIENGYFGKVTERVAKATGVSRRTVIELLDDKDQSGFKPPKRKKKKISFPVPDNSKYKEIRNMIYNIQIRTKKDFSLTILHESLVEVIGYQGSIDVLKKILKQMGFKHMRVKNNDKCRLLVEKPKLRLRRLCYIREIQKVRNAAENIVYIGETYVRYTKLNEEDKKNDKVSTSKERMSVIHAGNANGFLPGALMLSKSSDSDYRYEKELSAKFKHWVYNQLIPTLPPNSLLVIEDAPWHNVILIRKTKPPSAYAQKHEFIAWLTKNTLDPVDPNLTKPELYDKICGYYKENTIPHLLQDYGHRVLMLPKYHTDLNPIEKLWADLNGYVSENIEGLSATKIETLIKEKIESMGTEQWSITCQEVIQLEDECLIFEEEFDKYTDNFIITEDDESGNSDHEISAPEMSAQENSDSQSESEFTLIDVKEHLSPHNN